MIEPFYFDAEELQKIATKFQPGYDSAAPFPHCVIDDFMSADALDLVLAEFPSPNDIEWLRYVSGNEVKLALRDDTQLGPYTRHLLAQFNSSVFVDFLEALTGITGLVPDPHYWGGGLHQIERGGHLKVHADFNKHERLDLDRRINVLLYLNKDWDDSYGGHLELWDENMTTLGDRVLPVFNRCVVFNTTDYAMHGHPDPLTCPEDRTRRSMALYYYTNGRPDSEVRTGHNTLFKRRPGERWKRGPGEIADRWLPPVVRDRLRRS